VDFRDAWKGGAAHKIRREFLSSHNAFKTTEDLREGLGRWEHSLKTASLEGQIDALGQIIVCCLGCLEALGCDTEKVLRETVSNERESGLPPGPSRAWGGT
jgi:hypothetical protein